MVELSCHFTTLLLAIITFGTTYGEATPSTLHLERAYPPKVIRRVTFAAYHPPTSFIPFHQGVDLPPSASNFVPNDNDALKMHSQAFIASWLKQDPSKAAYRAGYTSSHGTSYAYLSQSHDGIPFANSVSNVAIKNNRVIAFGHSFVNTFRIAPSKPTFDLKTAVTKAERTSNGTYNQHPTKIEYLVQQDGSVALTYVIQIQNVDEDVWVETFVDAHSGEVLQLNDFLAEATYKVLPLPKEYPTEGYGFVQDPEDLVSSPFGWMSSDGITQSLATSGNNVIAFVGKNGPSATATSGSPETNDVTFDYTYDDTLEPAAGVNSNASRVNAFYLANVHHDMTYRYGFTENAFNFQLNNNGKGGLENDRINISVQSTSGSNNANFITPPDGQTPSCRFFLWRHSDPERDGGVENDLVLHEMTHGLTSRMVGGGTARCLLQVIPAGLGEGWSDSMADWFAKDSAEVPDFTTGKWVANNETGIRTYPYSTNNATNPLKYSDLKVLDESHDIGEVWANTLHNVYAALVAKYGWSPNARTDTDGTEGNIVFMHHFIDSLSLMPCSPTFLNARDAWILADSDRYNGTNFCLLWQVFASKGMGVNADSGYDDNYDIPEECR